MSGPNPTYPPGTVRALLDGQHVTEPTRAALRLRLADGAAAPRYFDADALATLVAVCARLVPQPERRQPIDLAATIDARLAEGRGDGWRYAALPPDGEAYRRGLGAIDESATAMFGAPYAALDAARQDAVLLAVQRGEVAGGGWHALPAARFFEELLTEAVAAYYSHPLAQEEIGYVGMADAPGWQRIGLDELESREPRAAGRRAS